MHIRVLYFASLRESRGVEQEELIVDPGSTIAELYRNLFGGASTVAFTRNRAVVPGETVLQDGDEVSFLPPLGGG